MDLIDKYTVRPTATFKEEVKSIIYYIKVKFKQPLVAKEFYNNIVKKISSLDYMPERYMKVNFSNNRNINIHKLPIKDYLIIYEVNKNTRTSFCFTYFSLFSKLF